MHLKDCVAVIVLSTRVFTLNVVICFLNVVVFHLGIFKIYIPVEPNILKLFHFIRSLLHNVGKAATTY